MRGMKIQLDLYYLTNRASQTVLALHGDVKPSLRTLHLFTPVDHVDLRVLPPPHGEVVPGLVPDHLPGHRLRPGLLHRNHSSTTHLQSDAVPAGDELHHFFVGGLEV